ncbi:hypothetical protein [Photobacterium atrarenae]|uniref:Uncharacterized protein n=1 Tax=Photobacterium atrarenae TaxID=865757 RepID=A0ABY5GE24_9GAMM|nr:hypothetical protein [Photobacterium atrarenae]UTV27500.1 hypothetical protein NNL38_14485 [Photobacterium atrarenae]
MKFAVIHADNPALAFHLERLKRAFNGVYEGDNDYQEMVDGLKTGALSLYHITGHQVDLSFVGEINGDDYFAWAICGKGMRAGVAELMKRVRDIGLKTISCGTGSPVIARFHRQAFGAAMTGETVHDNGAVTTWHRVEVGHG